MTVHLAAARRNGTLLCAVLRNGAVSDLLPQRLDRPSLRGSIWRGRVLGFDRRAGIARLALASGLTAVVPAPPEGWAAGDTAIVQIKSDGRQDKSPQASPDIGLPGRTVIFRPTGRDIQASRNLDRRVAKNWREKLPPLGLILRRAIAEAEEAAVLDEIDELRGRWQELTRGGPGGGQGLLLPAPSLLETLGNEIGVAGPVDCQDIGAVDAVRAAGLEGRLRDMDWPDQVDHWAARDHDLGDNGRLVGRVVVEHTQALIAIDVDAKGGAPARVNEAAAAEIARLIRRANLCGILMIDFLKTQRQGGALSRILRTALADDVASHQVAPALTPAGILEISRARFAPGLAECLASAPSGSKGPTR